MDKVGKVISCRAAVNWAAGQACSIENVEVAPPKTGEIRVKMAAVGICFSDVTLGKGTFPQLTFPTVLGHEGVGIVESVGQGVTSYKIGDTVIPLWNAHCGQCRWCQRGKRNICQSVIDAMKGNLSDGTKRITCKDQEISQAMGVGLFSDYVVIPEIAAIQVRSHPKLENLASYGCCVPTGYGAARYTANVDEGSVVAIWGLGAIGLCCAMGCRDAKAARIIGIDINPDKFDIGKKFGCTEFLNPLDHQKPISAVLKEMTRGLGVDYAFVCIGRTDVMEDALEACSVGGSECVIVGIGNLGEKISVNHTDLIFGKNLKGSWCGDCICKHRTPDLVDKYIQGLLPTDLLMTQTLPLEKINEGFQLLKDGKAIRAIIKM